MSKQKQVELNPKYEPLFQIHDYPEIRYIIITGGRGSSKSYTGAVFLTNYTFYGTRKVLFCRYTLASAKDSIIPEFTEKLDALGYHGVFHIANNNAINPTTKNEILFRGIKTSSGNQTAKLKSLNGITMLVVDEAEEFEKEDEFDTIDLSIRDDTEQNLVMLMMNKRDDKHWIIQRFFKERGIPEGFNGIYEDTLYIHTTYLDNLDHLNQSFIDQAIKTKKRNPAKYTNIFLGHAKSDVDGAHWRQAEMIDAHRVWEPPRFKRIVTAVDPSISDDDGDECGIVTCGEDYQIPPHYYIWKDDSGQYTNAQWGKKAVDAYYEYEAHRMVAEKNQGGDLVKMNMRTFAPGLPIKGVHAKQGKMLRAEPVAALAEEGRLHHIGRFDELEHEMTTYTGEGKSPNRLDAAVYGILELSQNPKKKARLVE